MVRACKILRQSSSSVFITGTLVAIAFFLMPLMAAAQQFSIEKQADALWVLSLKTGDDHDTWQLPYQVYRFATADVNGDGLDEALVGVYKTSRYFTQPSRRVFIFKNYHGLIRPLWLSSRLGGDLVDFTIEGSSIRAIEVMTHSDGVAAAQYHINDYAWRGFGMGWTRCVAVFTTLEECYQFLNIKNQ